MSNNNLVSILIPAFNAEAWITEAIVSALNQTWPYKELIIVDDGSTDRTFEIAKHFEGKNVLVFSQRHSGACVTRNNALYHARGNYIQWLDADDILAPNKIEEQMKVAKYHQQRYLLFSSAWGKFLNNMNKAKFNPTRLWQDMDPIEWIYEKLNSGYWMAIESWLVSRDLAERAGPWDIRLSMDDDGDYFCRVVAACKKIIFVPRAKSYCRRVNTRSLSSTTNLTEEKIESQMMSSYLQSRCLLSFENSPRTRTACIKEFHRVLILCYPEKERLFSKASEHIRTLGRIHIPSILSWKYSWINKLFGWKVSKKIICILLKINLFAHIYSEKWCRR